MTMNLKVERLPYKSGLPLTEAEQKPALSLNQVLGNIKTMLDEDAEERRLRIMREQARRLGEKFDD